MIEPKFDASKKTLYGTVINYWDFGLTKVLGRTQTSGSLVIMIATMLGVYGFKFQWWEFVLAFLGMNVIVTIVGFFYVKKNFYKKEVDNLTLRNPYNLEMLNRVRNIERLVEEIAKERKIVE